MGCMGCPTEVRRSSHSLFIALLGVPVSWPAQRAVGSQPSTCADTLTHFSFSASLACWLWGCRKEQLFVGHSIIPLPGLRTQSQPQGKQLWALMKGS